MIIHRGPVLRLVIFPLVGLVLALYIVGLAVFVRQCGGDGSGVGCACITCPACGHEFRGEGR
jgi:hypothetical protein